MYSVKLESKGVNSHTEQEAVMTMAASFADDELYVALGKVIYAMEAAGMPVDTHKVYIEAMAAIADAKGLTRYKKVVDRPEITISVMKKK